MNINQEVNALRSAQILAYSYRGNRLLHAAGRDLVQTAVGNLVKQIEIELAYAEAVEHGESCTCTPRDAVSCDFCNLAAQITPTPAALVDDIPF